MFSAKIICSSRFTIFFEFTELLETVRLSEQGTSNSRGPILHRAELARWLIHGEVMSLIL